MSNILGKIFTRLYTVRQYAARVPSLAKHRVRDSRAESLTRSGLLVLPELVSTETIARLNSANSQWFDLDNRTELVFSPDGRQFLDGAASSRAEVEPFYFLHIKSYHCKFKVYDEIVPRIATILRSYYRSCFAVRDVECYRTQPIPVVRSSYAWHRDNYPPGCLKVMLYLTPVTTLEDGPFTLALESHLGFYPELGKIGDRHEDAHVRARYNVFHCFGPAGTVIIFNNNAIHRAVEPTRGHRDVINFTVFPSLLPPQPLKVRGVDLNEGQKWLKKYTR